MFSRLRIQRRVQLADQVAGLPFVAGDDLGDVAVGADDGGAE